MFDTDMKESMENKIVLPNTRREVFEEFLRFLYTDAVPGNIEDLAPSLLPLADQYMVESLRQICARATGKACSNRELTLTSYSKWALLRGRTDSIP